ncbi:hypothetical protein C9F11_10250 [Streptomyces sp. YIM 121038]|nr:hypothetical protein C9F11_10250 [Streptomyces sp. YIM 121038]
MLLKREAELRKRQHEKNKTSLGRPIYCRWHKGRKFQRARIRARQHRMDGWSMTPRVGEWQRQYAFMLREGRENNWIPAPFREYTDRVRLWPLR